MAATREYVQEEVTAVERGMRRIFLGACALSLSLVFVMMFAFPEWMNLPIQVRVGIPGLLLWSLIVTSYAFLSLYRFASRIKEQLSHKTFIDELTGAFNFRYLDRRLTEENERTRRYGSPTAILYLDLDKFKSVNDRFGHQAGNTVLADLADLMKKGVRSCDVLGRVGGDEFMALLPETDRVQAAVLAERLRARVEEYALDLGESGLVDFVTVSIGLAVFPANGDSMESVVSAADKSVYKAKSMGGNKLHVCGEFITTEQVGERVVRRVEARVIQERPGGTDIH